MNKTTLKIVVLTLVMHAIAMSTNGQDPQKAKMTPSGTGYLEYLPADYNNSTEKYPTIIFLHGSGERGTGTASDLAKVKANGPPKHIKNGHKMCFTVNGKTECFIVLSPQTGKWSWKYDVVPFVKYALATYRIDPTRVYLTGLSMGGEGTWFGASLEDNIPNLFAAIAPMCGRGAVTDGKNVAAKQIPVWGFHGDADTAIPLEAGERPINAMKSVNANPAPLFTIYAGGSHSTAWDRGYRTDHSYHTPNVYEWFLTHRLPEGGAPNIVPTVNAGADQTITLPTNQLSLTAAATDMDGTIKTYQWTKVSGPAATMSNATTQTLSLSNMPAGVYSFRITVTDNSGASATDEVNVTVYPAPGTNQSPVVDAGGDLYPSLPITSFTITANASDTDGAVVSYKWSKASGPGSMSNSSTKTVTLSNITSTGTITLNVTVTDNMGATGTDQVKIYVSANGNKPPVVTTSSDQSVTLPTNQVTVTASASDPDGTITGYAWTKTAGPSTTLANTSTPALSASNLIAGTYTFKVTVTDDKNATATGQVIVTVNPAQNQAPTVNAGADQSITLPVNQVTLNATASDADGSISGYSWSKKSGPAANLSGTNTSALSVTGMIAGTYTFTVTATDNLGATATDDVTVIVNASTANQPPVVEAGAKQTITLPSHTATFTAVASDVDGTIASYSWKKIGGSNTITMIGTSSSTLSVSNVVAGTYVFRVEVSDNKGATAADTVRLKVNAATTTTTTTQMTAATSSTTGYTLSLGQNYPNPVASGLTTIPYGSDANQRVVIKVYNSVGYEVATVLDETVTTGEHEVQFNTDVLRAGNGTAGSVFYYKLMANGQVITKQMAIL